MYVCIKALQNTSYYKTEVWREEKSMGNNPYERGIIQDTVLSECDCVWDCGRTDYMGMTCVIWLFLWVKDEEEKIVSRGWLTERVDVGRESEGGERGIGLENRVRM